jgi:hypothetical protein
LLDGSELAVGLPVIETKLVVPKEQGRSEALASILNARVGLSALLAHQHRGYGESPQDTQNKVALKDNVPAVLTLMGGDRDALVLELLHQVSKVKVRVLRGNAALVKAGHGRHSWR